MEHWVSGRLCGGRVRQADISDDSLYNTASTIIADLEIFQRNPVLPTACRTTKPLNIMRPLLGTAAALSRPVMWLHPIYKSHQLDLSWINCIQSVANILAEFIITEKFWPYQSIEVPKTHGALLFALVDAGLFDATSHFTPAWQSMLLQDPSSLQCAPLPRSLLTTQFPT